jgi:drug/metabolite transporter (DMT)-like permease
MIEVIALVIALAASFCTNYSTYLQKKAVDLLPQLKLRLTWTVLKTFFSNRPWLYAMLMDGIGTGLYMVALIWLPVSIVEPIISAGIALLAYLAIKNLGEEPGPGDLLAIGAIVLGVVFLAISLGEGLPAHNTYNSLELWIATVVVVSLAVVVPLALYFSGRGSIAAGLGFSGGLAIGLAAVFSRLLMADFGGLWYVWLLVCILTYPVGFGLFQAGLQRGKAVVVAPIYNSLVLCVPVVLGMLALNESMPHSALLAALRIAAFVLIAFGAIFLSRTTAAKGLAPHASRVGE